MWCCRAFAIACSMSVVSNIPLRLALLSVSTFVILLWSTHIECMIVDRGRALSFSCSRLDTATLIFRQCILIRIKLELQKQRWQWQCDSTVLHRGTLHSLTHFILSKENYEIFALCVAFFSFSCQAGSINSLMVILRRLSNFLLTCELQPMVHGSNSVPCSVKFCSTSCST